MSDGVEPRPDVPINLALPSELSTQRSQRWVAGGVARADPATVRDRANDSHVRLIIEHPYNGDCADLAIVPTSHANRPRSNGIRAGLVGKIQSWSAEQALGVAGGPGPRSIR